MQVEYAIKQLSRQQKIAIASGAEVPKWSCYQEAALLKG
jgi:predicted GIY-YIG superfamily endonuclease